MKKSLYVVVSAGLGLGMAACSWIPDHSLDYRTSKEVPRMTLPAGTDASKVFVDAYPVPPETVKPVWISKKFEAPAPAPLAISGDAPADLAASGNAPQNVLTRAQDGNGYPTLNISGGFSQVWDTLDQALHAGNVKVDDRNQSLGLYYLELPDTSSKLQPFQLKVTRALSAYSLSLQKDDDTLAPTTVAGTLFDTLQAKWPKPGADEDQDRMPRGKR